MMTMIMMMLITMTMVQQPMMIAHITSKQTQHTTNKQNVLAGAHRNNSPGSSSTDSSKGEQKPASSQDMYMHIHRRTYE